MTNTVHCSGYDVAAAVDDDDQQLALPAVLID